jgi:DNA polymerase-4
MHYFACVSVERFYVRELAKAGEEAGDKPLIVARDGAVLDADERASAKGVTVGMPVQQAKSLLAEGVVVRWEAEPYQEAQRAWLDRCCAFSGVIEPEDQHIAYLDLSGHPRPADILEILDRTLLEATGLHVRVGAAGAKWIAKIAARVGGSELAVEEPAQFLSPLSVFALSPISEEHRTRLEFLGYRTIGEVARIPMETLRAQFGKEGLRIHRAASGTLLDGVRPLYPPDSLSEVFRFDGPAASLETLDRGLAALAECVGRKLLSQDKQGSELTAFVETEDGEILRFARTFTKPIWCPGSARTALRSLLGGAFAEPVTSIRVFMPRLQKADRLQPELLSHTPHDQRRAWAGAALRSVNAVFGHHAMRLASEVPVSRRTRILRAWRDATGWR